MALLGGAANGQGALSIVITGVQKFDASNAKPCGTDIASLGAKSATALGIGHILEDRLNSGFADDLPGYENVIFRRYKSRSVDTDRGFLRENAIARASFD